MRREYFSIIFNVKKCALYLIKYGMYVCMYKAECLFVCVVVCYRNPNGGSDGEPVTKKEQVLLDFHLVLFIGVGPARPRWLVFGAFRGNVGGLADLGPML